MRPRPTADQLMRPRYAWTNCGPVVVHGAGYYRTSYVRDWLKSQSIEVNRWARNWMAFEGYAAMSVRMPNPYGRA